MQQNVLHLNEALTSSGGMTQSDTRVTKIRFSIILDSLYISFWLFRLSGAALLALHYEMKATLQLSWLLDSLKCPLEQPSGRGTALEADPEPLGSESKPRITLTD